MAADDPDAQALRRRALEVMEAQWRDAGFTCPNARTYPWSWLWDSCFHAVIWAELGRSDRAVTELRHLLAHQDRSGFVPHMVYAGDPDAAAAFWGRSATSSITQPPMFGHAVAELARRGVALEEGIVHAARRGLWFLLVERRRSPGGLVELVHPWESGADDSPRWDHFAGETWTRSGWRTVKGELLATVERDGNGAPVANPAFAVGSVAFSALVAFNALELATVIEDSELLDAAEALISAIDARWDAPRRTWVDDGPSASSSGAARTAEALLALLVTRRVDAVDAVAEDLVDPGAFGGPFGPAGVHRGEPAFDRDSYWRGPAWPQLNYLLWIGARRHGRVGLAATLALGLSRGAVVSGMAEYWDPDNGRGGGAIPQSWSALALVVANPGASVDART